MAFKLENFGAEVANAKGTLGGVCYYRYFNEDNNTLTTAGYFPAILGLEVGDRIRVIPAVKTNPDEIYIVTSTSNRTVVVTQVDTDGAVDSVNGKTGAVVLTAEDVNAIPQYEEMPEATVDNAGAIVNYKGATNANYTNGYFYKNVVTTSYNSTETFEPATVSGTVVTCTSEAFTSLASTYIHADITQIVSGTMTFDSLSDLWVFVGKDSGGNTVGTYQVYQTDYENAGFTFTGTPAEGDVVAFTCTITESSSYAWTRIDVQPVTKELPTAPTTNGSYVLTVTVSSGVATYTWESTGE